MPYYAHSGKDQVGFSDWQLLRDHDRAVANGAKERADPLFIGGRSMGPAAFAMGLLHDFGKYRPEFQQRLRGVPVQRLKTHHKEAGAAEALRLSPKLCSVAFAILGHHGGLPDHADHGKGIGKGKAVADQIRLAALADCPELKTVEIPVHEWKNSFELDLETRLLFSCLIDADWSDTSEHDRQVRGWDKDPEPVSLLKGIDGNKKVVDVCLENVLDYISGRAKECDGAIVARARHDILQSCLKTGGDFTKSPGFFSLAVPTGGGKTLAALAFALQHAAVHGLRRVIYVAPYLSILDQNAKVIRCAIGASEIGVDVFEHHSLSDSSGETTDEDGLEQGKERRAAAARRAENWEAPVIVTTNVQFFESLFSNEPGRCRKFHNIAHSVIILDECQAIRPGLFAPTCAMLGQLVKDLGCTIVFATATQPVFDHPALRKTGTALSNIRPIVGADLDLFKRLRRVKLEWPRPDEYLEWTDVVCLMTTHRLSEPRASLCVVNTTRAARELFQDLDQGLLQGCVFHLSTRMCPAHRLAVLETVRSRLKAKEPCYLVSTQLIEAGVDIDFPLVLREMAPLEAILQAAGRCNREGLLNGSDGSPGGRVIIFRSRAADEEPRRYFPQDPWYVAGRDALQNSFINAGREPSIDDPNDISEYFTRLLNNGELDQRNIQHLRQQLNFPKVSKEYRLVDEQGEAVVVPNWKSHEDEVAKLLDAVRGQPTRRNFRRLIPFQVNLPFPTQQQRSSFEEGPHGLWIWRGDYDYQRGLLDEWSIDSLTL